jgi:hypothetical protein
VEDSGGAAHWYRKAAREFVDGVEVGDAGGGIRVLPGQVKLRRALQPGWNRKVAERRSKVAALIAALKKRWSSLCGF